MGASRLMGAHPALFHSIDCNTAGMHAAILYSQAPIHIFT